MTTTPCFSPESLKFLLKAGRQKDTGWLDRPGNRADYERLILEPLKHLAATLKRELSGAAPAYHFPQKGIGRLRRSARGASDRGGICFKSWMAYSASRPTASRFDHNPNLFFLLNPGDSDDSVLIAGGLYMPSSRQLRAVREAIARDPKPFERLFRSAEFQKRFPKGFSNEKSASRPPRGFDPQHRRADWLRLQAHFVWRPLSAKEFRSPRLAEIVAADFKQIVRLNNLLEQALGVAVRHEVILRRQAAGRKTKASRARSSAGASESRDTSSSLLERLDMVKEPNPPAFD